MASSRPAMPIPIPDPALATYKRRKNMFESAMHGEWGEVLDIYSKFPDVHWAKITRSGDTALHVAVSGGQEDTVQELVELIITKGDRKKALEAKNDQGENPLHLAASLGSVRMCKCIAGLDERLIGDRNNDNETPLFLAAVRGKKDAFLFLQSKCGAESENGYSYCRGKGGETILHSAITREYFDLAFQIIHMYEKLVHDVNEQGFSPLHLLAGKPSCFKSGSHLGRYGKIIYHFPKDRNRVNQPADTESQGSRWIRKVQEKKKKHTWSLQIMNELIDRSSEYEYEDDGQKPPHDHLQQPGDGETRPYDLVEGGPGASSILGFGTAAAAAHLGDDQQGYWLRNEPQAQAGRSTVAAEHSQLINRDHDHQQVPLSPTLMMPTTNILDYKMELSISRLKWEGAGSLLAVLEEKNANELIGKKEKPILIAAKNGVTEMVARILEKFPVAIHDMNSDKKNIVLLAVENRQPHVYEFLQKKFQKQKDGIFRKVDKDGNSALHLAATLGDSRPWRIPGAALQMQWEMKWYKFVKYSMPLHFFTQYNNARKTPKDIFTETHMDLVESGGKWLTNTSQSCSVVAALIATVAFATSSTVPGGVKQEGGTPTLEDKPPFEIFAVAALIALCFSVTALVMFLAILTSRYQEKDFHKRLPTKLLVGLTSLFVSIASILICFCAGHFFILSNKLKYAALPVYAVTSLPVTFFAIAQFPLYFDFLWATFKKVPQRSASEVSS